MPEVKNNFTGAKMNKDLSPRLISNNDYIDARNAAVMNSDGGNSGLLENVSGNRFLTNFNLEGFNLEIVGFYIDTTNNRLFAFVTDWNDSSPSELDNFASESSHHYICMYDAQSNQAYTLVSGNFLNFSKTHHMFGINLLEDLLFFTDNRNQPRKINVASALNDPNYYSKEEHISVAKYYPWQPIRLVENKKDGSLLVNSTFSIESNVFLPDGEYNNITASGFTSGSGAEFQVLSINNTVIDIKVLVSGSGYSKGDTLIISGLTGQVGDLSFIIKDYNLSKESTMNDVVSKTLPLSEERTVSLTNSTTTFAFSGNEISENWVGALITALGPNGDQVVSVDGNIYVTGVFGNFIQHTETGAISIGDTVTIGSNPYYNNLFDGDSEYLSDKFVRFSYRFKYDDGEYSLIAPFSQIAFIPKQDGYFLDNFLPQNVDFFGSESDENDAIKSTIISFFENKVNSAKLMIYMPDGVDSVSELNSKLKVKEIEILYKESDETSIKVIDTITKSDLLSYSGSIYSYTYNSQAPIRVLPQDETTRASDQVPIRAKAQEVSGGRVMYGNYLVRTTRPEISYSIATSEKLKLGELNSVSELEYPNHNLKQNRSYRVGIVLCDKFGRQSDVIISSRSTIYNPYRNESSAFITGEDVYRGESLKINFLSPIPSSISNPGYAGLYSETNPNGWYTYKVVVQQKEQDYYNLYLPTILNNYPQLVAEGAVAEDSDSTAFITLFSDNINKAPRDLKEVGPQQLQFSSSVNMFGRVWNSQYDKFSYTNKQFTPSTTPDKLIIIGTRDDIGLNTNIGGDEYSESPFFGVPKAPVLTVGSEEFNLGSNPYIGKLLTQKRIGATGGSEVYDTNGAKSTGEVSWEYTRLNVYETEPFKSNVDIFYETSTSGLISELNQDISKGTSESIPYSVNNWTWFLSESYDPGEEVSIEDFDVLNIRGESLTTFYGSAVTASVLRVLNGSGQEVTNLNLFEIEQQPSNKFRIKTGPNAYFTYKLNSSSVDLYDITIRFTVSLPGATYVNDLVVPSSTNVLTNNSCSEVTGFSFQNLVDRMTVIGTNGYGGLFSFTGGKQPSVSWNSFSGGQYIPDLIPKLSLTNLDEWVDMKEFDFRNGSASTNNKEGLVVELAEVCFEWVTPPWQVSGTLPTLFFDQEPYFNSDWNDVFRNRIDYSEMLRIIETPDGKHKLQYNSKFEKLNTTASNISDVYNTNPRFPTTYYLYINVADASLGAGNLRIKVDESYENPSSAKYLYVITLY